MGILNNSVSICQFQVVGSAPNDSLAGHIATGLQKNGFLSIEQSSEESASGWVHLDDFQQSGFENEQVFIRDHYYTFSFRRDQRKLPSALFKPYVQQAEQEWLANNQKFRRVPKQQREEIRDLVKARLFAKTLPIPTVYDLVWDSRSNIVTLSSLATSAIDQITELFQKSFPGLRLVPHHPMARAGQVIDDTLKSALAATNQASNETVLEQIEANQWLGNDLLLWLMHETIHSAAEYSINQPGPAVEGEGFVAYLNDRLLLAAAGEEGIQKVTVSGPQSRFNEVRTALADGKQIHEAVLYLERQENIWKMNLKGGNFHFASFKSPPVVLDRDETVDPQMEREALFFERMALIETGLQMFDSLLATFLQARLAEKWPQKEQQIFNQLAAA